MVAVFTGNGLGLFNTSLTQLGGAMGGSGGLGQDRSRQLVNLATGNVVVHAQDEFVTNRGLSLAFDRTYNSRGLTADVGSDAWATGFERRIVLQSGSLNSAGSVVRRYMGDGSFQDFTFVSTDNYISTEGDGAHDTLFWDNITSTWRYRNGSTQMYEVYEDHASATLQGRLSTIQDWTSGGEWAVWYTGNRITAIRSRNPDPNTSTATGDGFLFSYDASGRLESISTSDSGVTRLQVSYAYDAIGRLITVTTDLTPGITTDNTWDGTASANNDGKLYRTEYTYEGTTLRLASLRQSDGTLVSYTYHADGRVQTVTQGDSNSDDSDGLGETITYAYGTGSTTVTDSLGRAWVYAYDANGQLASVTGPAVAGQSDITTYQYDAAGNVTQARTVRGGTTLSLLDYQYDANGNLTWQWDAQGNAINRTYNSHHQLLTETRYTGVDADRNGSASAPSGGLTTQYVYDHSENRVRFVVNALGEVTENTYIASSIGMARIASSRQYLGETYSSSEAIHLSDLSNWATAARKAQSTLTEFSYDIWDRLIQRTDYGAVNATTGNGELDAAAAITRYTYDVHGSLRQQITSRGAARTLTGAVEVGSEVIDYAYDGMGRLLSVLSRDYATATLPVNPTPEQIAAFDLATVQTTYAYIDSAYQIAVTTDAGAVRTETRNRAGRVVSATEADKAVAPTITRTSTNTYDSAGQLRISQDAGGGRSYFFYDAKGRLEATVDATGAGVRNSYDGLDRVVGTRAYVGRVTTTGWTTLALVPADFAGTGLVDDDALDRVSATTYDTAGRIATFTDGIASSTQRSITTYTYDGAGRLLQTQQTDSFANAVTARTVRYFYDNAGRQIGQLDAEGYLTESAYDRAGRLVSQVRYATVSPSAQWATGTLAQLRPSLNANNDQTTRHYYNGRGQLVGTLDAQGYLTELIVDEAGNTRAERRYATAVTWMSNDTLSTLRSRAGVHRESRLAYNGLGQLLTQTNAENTVTRYTYDEAGRLVKTESAQGTSEVRENNRRYNVFGELIGELAGEGSVQLLAGMSEAQLDAVYAHYGVRHNYDALGRRIESIDAGGNKTWYFYDSASRLTFTVKGVADGAGVQNALGEVTESRYNAFGEVSDSLAYTGRITIPVPGDRNSVNGTISTLNYVAATDTRRQFAYTARGQLASVTDAENALTEYTYDPFGQLSSRIVASGTAAASTQHYSYDRRGLLVDTTDDLAGANRRLTTSTYDAFGRMIGQHSANGSVTSFTYDRLGRQITHSGYGLSGQEEVWTTAYDAFSRITAVTNAMGHVSTYLYDDKTRSLTITGPDGLAVTTVHNRHGQTLTVTDAASRIVATNSYNRDGQLTSVTDALGHAASNEYDTRGLLAATVDASGRRVELRYDALGRVLQQIEDPGTGRLNLTTTYAYDGQGRQLTVTDASGRVTGYSYDREGRLTQVALDPAGLNYRTGYAYDAAGRQIRVTEGAGTASARVVEYNYDSLNRRISEVVDPGTGKLNLTTQYAYDNNDNLIRRTDGNGAVTRYYYDESNRLVATVDPLGGATRQWYDLNGRLVASRSFAQAVDASVLNNAADFYQVDAATVWNANDLSQFQVYDEDGRLRFQIDVSGSVRETIYDVAGRVVGMRAYAGNFASALLDLAGALHAGIATPDDVIARISGNDALDQRSWQVLDDAGRVRYTVDALGNVQELYYDASNRVVGTRGYATALVIDAALRAELNAGTAIDDMAGRLALVANDTKDLRSYSVFDAAGRPRYTVDAFGAVQEFFLDAAGRTVSTRRYGQAIVVDATLLGKLKAGTATVAELAAKITTNQALDQRGYQVFDEAGRLRLSIDAQGYAQELRYDAVGRVIQQLTHGGAIAAATLSANLAALQAGTVSAATAMGWLWSAETSARITTSIWDAGGRLRYTLARDWSTYTVSELRYDAVGRVTAQVAYAKTIPVTTAGTVAAIAAAVTTTGGDAAANQRMTRMVYDAEGQVRYTIDDLGGVTERRYNGLGQLVETRRYGLAIPTSTAATEAAVAAAVASQSGANVRITTTTYDSAGRVATLTDAAGNSESYGYDALGNRTSYTNKLGNLWTYAYDASGRRVSEISPQVAVAEVVANGTLTSMVRSLVTLIAYDALGNVVQRTEDAATGGTPRITKYEYDSRGHQIKTIFPDAGVIDPATGVINATGIQPTIEVSYNALGLAVVQKDVRGNYSYKTYDTLGQLAYEVDQEGYVTEYAYNAFGEQTTLRRYATKLGAIAGWSAGTAITLPQLTGSVIPHIGLDRVQSTSYDALGQKFSVTQQEVTYVTLDGGFAEGVPPTMGVPYTRFYYNGYGELWKTATRLDQFVGWTYTCQYYDELGRNTLKVDAGGYVTTIAYNAMGEVTQSTEHARALSSVASQAVLSHLSTHSVPPAAPSAGDALTGYDRTIHYTYDALGRKISETQLRYYHRPNSEDPHTIELTTGDIVTSLEYDAEGHALTMTVDGVTTETAYDALGRVVSVKEDERDVVRTDAQTQLEMGINLETADLYERSSPYTTMAYDAFGNVVQLRQYANGWRDGEAQPQTSTSDTVNTTRYDWQGRAVWEMNAMGSVTTRVYDAADHVLQTRSRLEGNDGRWATVVTTAGYDAVGQQITSQVQRERYQGSILLDTVSDTTSQVRYNAFGEIIAKDNRLDPTLATDSFAAQFVYDRAGRLIRSNAEGGILRDYGYNLAGHQVRESHWMLVTVADGSINGISAVTFSVLDGLGRVIQQTLPAYGDDLNAKPVVQQKYDRWGNVIEVIDARGGKTSYQYNQSNQVVLETRPQVRVVYANGSEAQAEPKLEYYYDIRGQLIGTRDANGNVRRMQYDDTGRLTVSWDAYDNDTTQAYDALGRQRLTQDPLGYVSFRDFDLAGRIVAQGDYLVTETSGGGAADISNLDLEEGAQGWQMTNMQVVNDPAQAYSGSQFARKLYTGNESGSMATVETVAVQPGQTVSLSAMIRVTGADDEVGGQVRIIWLDAAGNVIGDNSGNTVAAHNTEGWTLSQVVANAPAGAAYARLQGDAYVVRPAGVVDFDSFTCTLGADPNPQIGSGRERHVREAYGLNQNGDRLSVINEMNQTARYDYDSRGLVIRSQTAAGVVMSYAYDANGNKIRETNALSTPLPTGSVPTQGNGAIPNGNFEAGDTGWEFAPNPGATVQVVTSGGYVGPSALRMSGAGEAADAIAVMGTTAPVTAGQSVTVSAMVSLPGGTYGTSYGLQVFWYDANGNEISRSGQPEQQRGVIGSGWRRSTFTAVAPPGAVSAKAGIVFNASDSSTTSVLMADDFQWNLATLGSSDGLTRITDDEGEVVIKDERTWDYDFFNRVIDHNDLSGIDYDYSYDPMTGQLTSQSVDAGSNTGAGTRQYLYYADGRIREQREPRGEGTYDWTRYTYDAAGNRTSEETSTHDANGEVLHLLTATSYDSHNRITRVVQDDIGTGRRILDVRYSYDAAGNRLHVEAGTSYNPSGDQPINAGFEDGDTGWSLGAGWSITQDSSYTGSWGARYDGSGPHSISNNIRTPVQVGQTVSASVMVQQGASSAGDASARILIVWYDANGVPLPGGEGRTWVGGRLINSGENGEWQKSDVSTRVPAGAAFMGIEVSANKSSSHPLFVDDVQWSYQSDGSDGELTINQSYWFDYDKENRVTVANGRLVNGQILIADDDKSYGLGYDEAGRATSRTFLDNGVVKHEVTQYDQRSQRTSTTEVTGAGNILQDSYVYDEAGRQLEHREYFEPGTVRDGVDIGGWLKHAEITTYDADGRVLSTTVKGRALGWTATGGQPGPQSSDLSSLVDLATVDYATAGYDEAGRLNGYRYHYIRHEEGSGASSEDPANYTHTYTYTYEGHESYLEQRVSGVSSNNNFKPSVSDSTYDAWGRRTLVQENTPNQDVDDRVRYFSYDGEGNILRRREGTLDNGVFTQNDAAVLQTQLYAYVSGQHIGSGKYNGELDVIGRLAAYDSSETGSSKITVQSGDTLRGIAQRVYGNSNLWYVIAQANAIQDDSELAAGATLTIPEVKVTANDAQTFKPFNPSEAIGSTNPSLPYIPPPPESGCNAIAAILAIVIVAVAYVFAPYIAPVVQSVLGAGALATGVTAGVATVAASTVVRGVASAAGVASFNWRDVAVDGITAGVTAGMGSALGQAAQFTRVTATGATVLNSTGRVLQGLASYGGSMVANAVVGRDTNFSWKNVAATAVGSYLSSKINPTGSLGITDSSTGTERFLNNWAGGFADGSINATARRLVGGGKQDWGQIAVDAFGNALVQGLGNWQANRAAQRAAAPGGFPSLLDPDYKPDWLYGDSLVGISEGAYWDSPTLQGGMIVAEGYNGPVYRLPDGTIVNGNGNGGARGNRMGQEEFDALLRQYDEDLAAHDTLAQNGRASYTREQQIAYEDEWLLRETGLYSSGLGPGTGDSSDAYGLRAARGDATLLWDMFADSANSVGETAWSWFAQTDLGQSAMGERIMEQRTYVPHWNFEGIKAGILPDTTELGRRGTPGTFIDDAIGRTKAVYNLGRDLVQLGGVGLSQAQYILTGTRPYEPPRASYSDKQLSGASQVELATLIVPEVAAFGRSAKVLSNAERMRAANSAPRLTSTGARNTVPLTQMQVDEASAYARQLGFDGPIDYRPLDRGYNTSYSDYHWLMISDDLLPNPLGATANSRMSWRAGMAHEITGHMQANLAGKAFPQGSLLDEIQASARAARHTPDLSGVERFQLRRDAIERIKLHNQVEGTNFRWRDLKGQVWLGPLD